MPLKANLSTIPTTCPGCGFESDDPGEMVKHWQEAGELNFNGNTVEVPKGKMMVAQPKVVDRPLIELPKFSMDDLLQRKEGLPWWIGVALIVVALSVPSTRLALHRMAEITFQILSWAMITLLLVLGMATIIIVTLGPKIWDAASRWIAGWGGIG